MELCKDFPLLDGVMEGSQLDGKVRMFLVPLKILQAAKDECHKQLCTEAAQILLKSSVDTQHDNWPLLHPVRVVSEMGHKENFHGMVKSLHHAIGPRMIGCSAVGLCA